MWRIRTLSAILSAMLLWFGTATARELRAPEKPEATTCGEFGTSVEFEPTPSHAARKALKAQKLVFVLHVSGLFAKSEFT